MGELPELDAVAGHRCLADAIAVGSGQVLTVREPHHVDGDARSVRAEADLLEVPGGAIREGGDVPAVPDVRIGDNLAIGVPSKDTTCPSERTFKLTGDIRYSTESDAGALSECCSARSSSAYRNITLKATAAVIIPAPASVTPRPALLSRFIPPTIPPAPRLRGPPPTAAIVARCAVIPLRFAIGVPVPAIPEAARDTRCLLTCADKEDAVESPKTMAPPIPGRTSEIAW